MKKKITATVLSQKEIAPRIFDMWIATDLAEQAKAGQFIGVYPKDRSTLLPRPISKMCIRDSRSTGGIAAHRLRSAFERECETQRSGFYGTQ